MTKQEIEIEQAKLRYAIAKIVHKQEMIEQEKDYDLRKLEVEKERLNAEVAKLDVDLAELPEDPYPESD